MGYIDINNISSGGGGGDATAANQVTEINVLNDINSKLLPSGISINEYNEISSVASGITTTVVTYTVPVGKQNVLERISVSGENIALYIVLINGVTIDTQRTYFGGNLNVQFEFMSSINAGTVLNAGDIVSVTVLHNRPSVANFEGRIQMSQLA